MNQTPTPHIGAKKEEVAKTVLMPGDPLRAKWIAETYLKEVTCFNTVRNMLGFTGFYKNTQVSVMGSGMGMPSMGIYSYELFHFYRVDQIIRVGSAGSIQKQLKLKDVLLAMGASTNSNYAAGFELPGTFAPLADYGLLKTAEETASRLGIPTVVGNVLSSDTFYADRKENDLVWNKMQVLAVEMEAAALYMNAARAGKKALCMLTVSDDILTGAGLSTKERQESLEEMIHLALETAAIPEG